MVSVFGWPDPNTRECCEKARNRVEGEGRAEEDEPKASDFARSWPEMEDTKRSGVRAHVFLIIVCTIQISGSVWQIQNGCLFLLV